MLDPNEDGAGIIGNCGASFAMRYVDSAPIAQNDPIAQERGTSLPEASDVQIYRRYSKGRQPLPQTIEQQDTLAGLPVVDFSDNVIGQIQNINKDRLKLTDYAVDAPRGMSDDAAKTTVEEVKSHIKEFRVKAHFDAEANKINKAVLRDGNHAAGLGWDEEGQRVLLFQEPWWDGYCGMYVAYGENGLPLYGVKEWVATETEQAYSGKKGVLQRFKDFVTGALSSDSATIASNSYRYRTLYFPGFIAKYRQSQAQSGNWEQYQPEGEMWPIPWVKRDGSPLGIPIIHFSVGGDGNYGETVTPLAVLANQDFLNDIRLDEQGVARQTGFQRIVLSGFDSFQPGPDGLPDYSRPIYYNNQPGAFFITPNAAARAQVLEPGDPEGLIKIHNQTVESMCRQTQTPIYLISLSANMSGAAILRAEAPLAGKAQEQTESLGPSYATLMHRAIEIYNARNRAGITINEDAMITPVWADTSKPDAMAVVEFDQAKASLTRAQMVLEQEQKAIDEGRPIYLPPDDNARRLATVTVPADAQQIAAL